jgi:hypothetical protein
VSYARSITAAAIAGMSMAAFDDWLTIPPFACIMGGIVLYTVLFRCLDGVFK